MVVKKRGLLKSTKKKSPVNLAIYRTMCGERGIKALYNLLYLTDYQWLFFQISPFCTKFGAEVYFWLMAPQCIEDFWAQINLYMLFNQHDFTATLCISLTSQDYF